MTVFELGDGKQVVIGSRRIKIWAHGGGLGVDLTPEQMETIGLDLWTRGRRMKRECRSGDGS